MQTAWNLINFMRVNAWYQRDMANVEAWTLMLSNGLHAVWLARDKYVQLPHPVLRI